MKGPPVDLHVLIRDGIPDHKGIEGCLHCHLPESRTDVHTMPERTPEDIETEARMLGER